MLDALADGEDVGVRSLHVVVDYDAATDFKTGHAAQFDVGANSRRDDHDARRDGFAIVELDAFHVPIAQQRAGLLASQHADAQVLHLAGQHGSAGGIELPLHQRGHQVDHGDVATLHLQSAGGFQA